MNCLLREPRARADPGCRVPVDTGLGQLTSTFDLEERPIAALGPTSLSLAHLPGRDREHCGGSGARCLLANANRLQTTTSGGEQNERRHHDWVNSGQNLRTGRRHGDRGRFQATQVFALRADSSGRPDLLQGELLAAAACSVSTAEITQGAHPSITTPPSPSNGGGDRCCRGDGFRDGGNQRAWASKTASGTHVVRPPELTGEHHG
jgi:hypothetical protein